jgi:hypothetical protein
VRVTRVTTCEDTGKSPGAGGALLSSRGCPSPVHMDRLCDSQGQLCIAAKTVGLGYLKAWHLLLPLFKKSSEFRVIMNEGSNAIHFTFYFSRML